MEAWSFLKGFKIWEFKTWPSVGIWHIFDRSMEIKYSHGAKSYGMLTPVFSSYFSMPLRKDLASINSFILSLFIF